MDTVDRLSPRTRPVGPPSGYQRWRDLLFVHWEVSPEALSALLPKGLELDLYHGQALVGAVPFLMEGVRPRWSPEALAFNFLETNLRAYVTYKGEPGVYFFSLEAASRVAVCAARVGWSLPYFFAQMDMSREGDVLRYSTQRVSSSEAELSVEYKVGAPLPTSEPSSLEFFLLERYLLFTERRGRLYRGQVYHTPYPAHQAELLHIEQRLTERISLPLLDQRPRYVHYSPGVDVEVFALEPR